MTNNYFTKLYMIKILREKKPSHVDRPSFDDYEVETSFAIATSQKKKCIRQMERPVILRAHTWYK